MLRHRRRPASLALTAAILVALCGAAPMARAADKPPLSGVQLHSLWFDSSSADMDRELDLAASAGANVVRVDVVWGSLETGGKGQYSQWYVEKLDRFMTGATGRGMKVVAVLHSTPCWASTAPDSVRQGCTGAWWDRGVGAYPPRDVGDYGDAARFVTSRYGTRLAALEIWNEPNLAEEPFWRSADKAGDYARLLKAAYPAAKAGNSQVPVLAGSLAFADRPFLDQLYANGIRGFYDGIAVHPYNEARHPADRWQDEWKKYTLLPGLEWIHDGMIANHDDKPIWITEFGWTTGTASGWRVSEAQQADFIGASFSLLAKKSYVRSAIVYNLREKGTDPASHEDNFGLVNRDFSPKPAYQALKHALTVGPPAASAGSSSKAARPASGGGRKQRRVRRLSARLVRKGTVAKLEVVGNAGLRVRVQLNRCRVARAARTLTLRVGSRGRSVRRFRSARKLRGCRVRATAMT
jgi:polysaccharide biosynthesis protein PslG